MQLAARFSGSGPPVSRFPKRPCEVTSVMAQTDCLFCKIVKGEIPCIKVYETDRLLSFLDIAPAAPGHALIVPKEHAPTLLDLPPAMGAELLDAVQRVGRAVMAATGATGMNVLANTFASAGQVVLHAHLHVIPRTEDDGLAPWTGKPYASNEAMLRLAEDIRSRITV